MWTHSTAGVVDQCTVTFPQCRGLKVWALLYLQLTRTWWWPVCGFLWGWRPWQWGLAGQSEGLCGLADLQNPVQSATRGCTALLHVACTQNQEISHVSSQLLSSWRDLSLWQWAHTEHRNSQPFRPESQRFHEGEEHFTHSFPQVHSVFVPLQIYPHKVCLNTT